MRISDWSSDVCSSDLGGYGIKQAAADQHNELSAGARDRDVETLWRKDEIALGQGEFGIGDAIGQYDRVAFLALNPVDGFYEGTATQSRGQGIADRGAWSSVGTDDRTEERSVGKEGVSTCRSRGWR